MTFEAVPDTVHCPHCDDVVEIPMVRVLTADIFEVYGSNALQCDSCGHLWNPEGPTPILFDLR